MADRNQDERSLREDDATRMTRLALEYERVGDYHPSTAEDVQMLGLKATLEEADLVDRGKEREPGIPRYGLEPSFLERVARVTAELQEFLFKASVLVMGRRRYFHVDLESVLIPILEKSSDLPRILMAWEMLRSRLTLGHSFFLKYQKELRLPDSIADFSPVSTSAQLQEEVKKLNLADGKMRHVLAYYPHHNEGTRHERNETERLCILRDDWLTVIQRMGSSTLAGYSTSSSDLRKPNEEVSVSSLENVEEPWQDGSDTKRLPQHPYRVLLNQTKHPDPVSLNRSGQPERLEGSKEKVPWDGLWRTVRQKGGNAFLVVQKQVHRPIKLLHNVKAREGKMEETMTTRKEAITLAATVLLDRPDRQAGEEEEVVREDLRRTDTGGTQDHQALRVLQDPRVTPDHQGCREEEDTISQILTDQLRRMVLSLLL
ncbi:hypothetical protein K438DRAFT_2010749 [Mycena galopus ATCC 62051]|nr:hypothetical protein K438DRAFT_2010749 [Mycena galopus ATCC 62051]